MTTGRTTGEVIFGNERISRGGRSRERYGPLNQEMG